MNDQPTMEPSLSKDEPPLWELCKENAAPLERGRNVSVLEKSFREVASEKETMIRHYESLVRPYEQTKQQLAEDDDPLIHWLSYIKFYEESFPADRNERFLLLERCFRSMIPHARYQDDVRFIQVCCFYAEMTSREHEIFRYLYSQRVGLRTAAFWVAWAFKAEKDGDYQQAQEILMTGINKYHAHPKKIMNERYLQFQRRFVNYMSTKNEREMLAMEEYEQETRGTLGGLTREAVRRNSRSQGASLGRTEERGQSSFISSRQTEVYQQSNMRNQNLQPGFASFSIYAEESNGASSFFDESIALARPSRLLERERDIRKENTMGAEPWNERGGLCGRSTGPCSSLIHKHQSLPFTLHVDEECLIQHQQDNLQKVMEEKQMRQQRDERTFQEHEGKSHISAILSKDPLRYMKDPTLYVTDQAVGAKSKDNPLKVSDMRRRLHRTGTVQNRLTSKLDPRIVVCESVLFSGKGTECCFEEARASAGYYMLSKPLTNMNLFEATADETISVDSDNDVSMEEATMMLQAHLATLTKQKASSHIAVSAPSQVKAFAMMSPSLSRTEFSTSALNSQPEEVKSIAAQAYCSNFHQESHPETSLRSTASSTLDESLAVGAGMGKDEQTINTALARRELSMMFGSPLVTPADTSKYLDQSLEDALSVKAPCGAFENNECAAMKQRVKAPSAGGLTFNIYCDDGNNDQPNDVSPSVQSSAKTDDSNSKIGSAAGQNSVFAVAAVEIFASESSRNTISDVPISNKISENSVPSENDMCSQNNIGHASRGPMDLLTNILEGDSPVPGNGEISVEQKENDDRTVDIALLANLFSPTQEINAEARPYLSPVIEEGSVTLPTGTASCREDGLTTELSKSVVVEASLLPGFGDVSGIAFADEDATFTFDTTFSAKKTVDFKSHHESEVKKALHGLRTVMQGHLPGADSLGDIFATEGLVCSCPMDVIPRAFRCPKIESGTEIRIGHKRASVRRELGRGNFGIVVLIENSPDKRVAVKVQKPAKSLALEFEILRKLDKRLNGVRHPVSRGVFFPHPYAYLSAADGAMMSMTASYCSGLSVLDLVHIYDGKLGTAVPSILALHYTSRMLHHLELLHWHGKILHCDTKADNWILTTSVLLSPYDGAELMLVDFGRAVDLESLAAESQAGAMNIFLTGEACSEEMQCVSMRKSYPWSFDIDTYGVCATAHALLFGKHLQLHEVSGATWKPVEVFKENAQCDIWIDIFDSLLNLDEVSKTSLGSHPNSVRRLRSRIEKHLSEHRVELDTLLQRQLDWLR